MAHHVQSPLSKHFYLYPHELEDVALAQALGGVRQAAVELYDERLLVQCGRLYQVADGSFLRQTGFFRFSLLHESYFHEGT